MTTFELTYITIPLDDGKINIEVYPLSEQISKYIASYKVVDNDAGIMAVISNFIVEMTPILYTQFKAMDNVPQEIRDSYTL